MALLDEVKQNLQKVAWTEEWKQKINNLLPSLGQETLRMVENETATVGAELIGKYLVSTLEKSVAATTDWKNGNFNTWLDLAAQAPDDRSSDFGRYFIGPILDAKHMWRDGSLPKEIGQAWINLELQYYSELPENEYVELVSKDLLTSMQVGDFLLVLKKYYSQKVFKTSPWIRLLQQGLMNNKEELGNGKLNIEGKTVSPAVGNWLNDYVAFTSKTGSQKGTLAEIQYMEQSQNIKALSEEDKRQVFILVKLYDWLLNPIVNAEELEQEERPQLEPEPQPEEVLVQAPIEAPVVEEAPVLVESAPMPPPSFNFGVAPGQGVNLQEVLKKNLEAPEDARGVQMVGTEVPAQAVVENKPVQQTEDQINKKLEELKNKTLGQ